MKNLQQTVTMKTSIRTKHKNLPSRGRATAPPKKPLSAMDFSVAFF
jgi:hypothetical protein